MKRIILRSKPESTISGVVHVALQRTETMKSSVRSPAFRRKRSDADPFHDAKRFRLKAGLRTDFRRRKSNEIKSQSPSRPYPDTAVIPTPDGAEPRSGAAAG